MSPRLVAAHTPDVCWPGNGWERDSAGETETPSWGEKLVRKRFVTGECRVFRQRGIPEYVVFWHKVGDRVQSYGTGYAPPWWAWIDELRRGGLDMRQEQLFVRISSDRPIDRVLEMPEAESLWQSLLDLGLAAPPSPNS